MTLAPRKAFTSHPTLKKKSLLRELGLPENARWPEAAGRLKTLLVSARRSKDDSLAAILSTVKAYLRKRLPNVCRCGTVIQPRSRQCPLCYQGGRVS